MVRRVRSRVVAARRSDRGAAALEFALVSVPLLYLVLGIITYGYLLAFRQNLSQAAAEGARAAAVAANDPVSQAAAARGALNDSLTGFGLSCSTTNTLVKDGGTVGSCSVVVATCVNDATHRCATVSLDYQYRAHPLVPLPGMGIVTPADVTYSAVAEVSS